MSYNKEIDYQEKINEAVKKGDYESAALYEKSRNEKIDAENLDYEKTDRYSGWLDKTDYSVVLRDQMKSGASRKKVAETLAKRVDKASGTDGLIKYARDDVYDEAVRYIMGEGSFTYQEKEPVYEGKYDEKIDALYRQLANIKKFSYNPLDDELYEYYRNEYLREGNRAMEDVLGELATNTGGVASSYAASAAAQSRNYYNQKLLDKIPELYMSAYERYLKDIGLKEENLRMLLDMREDDYGIYRDSVSQYNKNREYEYQKFLDERDYEKYLRDEERKDEEFEYKKFLDERDYENYLREEAIDYQKYLKDEERKDEEFEYNKILDEREYQQYLDEKERKDAEFEYKKYVDNRDYQNLLKEQEREQEERNYNRGKDKIDFAIEKWQTLGYLDEESAEILGLQPDTHTVEYDYKQAQEYKIYNK